MILKWKVKHTNDFATESDFLETILRENGVENIPQFLNPSKSNVHDPMLMKNMAEACAMLRSHLDDKIFLYVDTDVDGVSSAAIMYQFLHELNPDVEIDFDMPGGKSHGLTVDMLQKGYGLAVVPDASSEELDEIKGWFPDMDILFLDHHEVDVDVFTGNGSVMINCTDGQYPNPTLCGAAVVQKFIEAYHSIYTDEVNSSVKTNYLDLVSLGLIADSMDARNLETRWYMLEGLNELYYENTQLNALEEFYKEDLPWGRYIVSIGWQIAPKINGMIRFGKKNEIMDMVKGFFGFEEDREYQPRRKRAGDPMPPVVHMTLQEWVAHNCNTVKNRQDTAVRKNFKELQEKIEREGLDKNSFIFVDATKVLEKGTLSGLVANKLATEYMRPVLLMRKMGNGMLGGSMRNYGQGNIENLKDYLNSIGIWCQGHQSAGGIRINPSELEGFINKVNEDHPLDTLETIYEVDWEIPAENMCNSYVSEVAENYAIFGNKVPTPRFAISGLKINASNIQTFGEGKFIRFQYNGITFAKKYCKSGEYEDLCHVNRRMIGPNKQELEIDMICEFTNNYYEGKTYPEVRIQHFESKVLSGSMQEKKEISKVETVDNFDDFLW